MPTKKDFKLLKRIFKEELFNIQANHNVELELSGFDSDVKTVFVFEKETSNEPVTFEMLRNFESRIQSELGLKYQVGIMYTDISAWEAEQKSNLHP